MNKSSEVDKILADAKEGGAALKARRINGYIRPMIEPPTTLLNAAQESSREEQHTVHIFQGEFKGLGKRQLLFCKICRIETVHTTPFFGYPFRCIANHGGSTLCDCCSTYTDFVAGIVITPDKTYNRYCKQCCEPDSPEKRSVIEVRRKQAFEDSKKSLDLGDSKSIARALGASSFR